MSETCSATKISPTATGDVEVRCKKTPGHDGKHEGKLGAFPVRWD